MPNSVRNIMSTGQSAQAALSISGLIADNLTAIGANQAGALLVTGDNNVFTTVAAGTGAILPATATVSQGVQPGDEVQIANLGANPLSVYPPIGGTIQGGAANAAYAVPVGKTAVFTARPGGTSWIALLSA